MVSHPPKLPPHPPPKDQKCPYCHRAFTSSSLGRHLDLYIKPKNPKPPDEIHIVEEIKRIRGNITRRRARTSSLKRRLTPQTPTSRPGRVGGGSSNARATPRIPTSEAITTNAATATNTQGDDGFVDIDDMQLAELQGEQVDIAGAGSVGSAGNSLRVQATQQSAQMPAVTSSINSNAQSSADLSAAQAPPARKKGGRPKGSKDEQPRKRRAPAEPSSSKKARKNQTEQKMLRSRRESLLGGRRKALAGAPC